MFPLSIIKKNNKKHPSFDFIQGIVSSVNSETGQTVFANCVLFIISWLITILGINTKSNTEYNCTVKSQY